MNIKLKATLLLFLLCNISCFISCDFTEFNEGDWACSSDSQDNVFINVMPISMNFESNDENSKNLTITSNTSWNISVKHDWCHVSVLSGNGNKEISVYCDRNRTSINRQDTIIVSSNIVFRKIPVYQAAAPYYISIIDKILEFNCKGETKSIYVQSNIDWKFKRHPESSSGISTIRKVDNELFLTIEENPYAIERTDTIVVEGVEYKNLTDTVYVTQKPQAPYLRINESEASINLNVDKTESTQSISISSNAEWKIDQDGSDWCSIIEPKSNIGSKDAILRIKVKENPVMSDARSAKITITTTSGSPTVTRTITIVQSKGDDPYIRINEEYKTLNFDAKGEKRIINVESNISWIISDIPSWCTITPSKSSLSQSVEITAARNSSSKKRSATIQINANPSSSKVDALSIILVQDPLDVPGSDDNPSPN